MNTAAGDNLDENLDDENLGNEIEDDMNDDMDDDRQHEMDDAQDDELFDDIYGEFDEEVEVSFLPRSEALSDLGISDEQFEAALIVALDEREALVNAAGSDEDLPPLEQILLHIGGKSYQIDELADIEIEGDV